MLSVQAEGVEKVVTAATRSAQATRWARTWLESIGLEGPVAWLDRHPPLASGLGLLLMVLFAWGTLYLARGHLLRLIGAF
ncbi:MAG TPA: hypothetical protein VLQ93_01530, partial [Myxococcaceae bacterium]|nr:hypothetical protein [Myxococcaceae bacterium]